MGLDVRQRLPQTVAQRECVKGGYCRRLLKPGASGSFSLIAKVPGGQPRAPGGQAAHAPVIGPERECLRRVE